MATSDAARRSGIGREQEDCEWRMRNWKSGGYRDWQEHQEALEATRQFFSDAKELSRAAGGDLAGKLAVCLAARIAVALRYLPAAAEDAKGHLEGYFHHPIQLPSCGNRRNRLLTFSRPVDIMRPEHECVQETMSVIRATPKKGLRERRILNPIILC